MDEILQRRLFDAGWDAEEGHGKSPVWKGPNGRYLLYGEVKAQPWDRYIQALLAESVLWARAEVTARAGEQRIEPVAFVCVRHLPPLLHERLSQFMAEVAPDQAWIAYDLGGTFYPHVPTAPELAQSALPLRPRPVQERVVNLFSDLNQWLIKVLLAPQLPEKWLSAPRERVIRNASGLAEVANVSVPVASRFLIKLEEEGHLDKQFGDLRVNEPLELLKKWRNLIPSTTRKEVAAQFARGPLDDAAFGFVVAAAASYSQEVAIALFGAADALGLGHARGAPRQLYVSSLEPERLANLGIVVDLASPQFQLVLRVPRFPQAVFRGAVVAEGNPVTDVIQCWLDASHYKLRGAEQADYLWRRALVPSLSRRE